MFDKTFFETKRTYRKFKNELVSMEIIHDICEAGRLSSCGANRQGIKLVVVNKPENVKEINSLVHYAGYLPVEVGTPKENEIPTLFIAIVQDTDVAPASDTDAGLVIGNMTTAAWMHGVGSCIMGAIDRPSIKRMLGIKEENVLHSVIAFGYPLKKSFVKDLDGDDIKYYLDDNGDTVVPKRKYEDIVRYF